MHDRTERVRDASPADVDLHQVGLLFARLLVVEAGVATRAGLQRVEEVEDDLRHRQRVPQFHARLRQIVHFPELAAAGPDTAP